MLMRETFPSVDAAVDIGLVLLNAPRLAGTLNLQPLVYAARREQQKTDFFSLSSDGTRGYGLTDGELWTGRLSC